MAVPWLRILDMIIGVTDMTRVPRRSPPDADSQQLSPGSHALGHLETRLAGVVVAALREAFDRDTRRLELEREQIEAERARAERALRLELLRQAGEREIGRLRLIAGFAVASWLGTLFFSARVFAGAGGGLGSRAAIGIGWVLLLAALALAFAAQSRVAAALDRADDAAVRGEGVASGVQGAVAPWLIVSGLALIGAAVLIA